jgi:hypothetical protein
VQAGILVGQAAANDLIAYRAADRDESITYTPGPLTPGGWTFAPPPSLQTAQTPWAAVMRPFMLQSPSQFRVEPPPSLASPQWAREYNEIKAYGAVNSTVRTPEQTAIAQFWNAASVNQSNQAFQDVAITHGMDLVDTALECPRGGGHLMAWVCPTRLEGCGVHAKDASAVSRGVPS